MHSHEHSAVSVIGPRPHHDGSALFVSEQSPAPGSTVKIRVRIPGDFGPVGAVRLRSTPDREPFFLLATRLGVVDGWEWWEADLALPNPVNGYRFLVTRGDGSFAWLNARGLSAIDVPDIDDFRIATFDAPPDWADSTVMYQIFPDRFARSAEADKRELPSWAQAAEWGDEPIHVGPVTPFQFYGGDLAGIVDHLDHLERLGVTLIYLTPVFPARSNHRYDAFSFSEVDPLLGGNAALIALVEAAHERGFKIIGDLTSNHSGDAHEWFTASYGNPAAPESDFYHWLNDEQTEYEAWLGVPSLPKFNWNSAELRRRFIEGPGSVVARWLEPPYNLDGWRIDVANMTGRFEDQDLNEEVRRIIRKTMIDVNPSTILLAEATNDAASDFTGDAWHGAMTYANLTRPLWSWLSEPGRIAQFFGIPYGVIPSYTGAEVYEAYTAFSAQFPWRVRMNNMNALDTHDTPRFRTHARPDAVPVAFGITLTMPGIPLIFAGDEFGHIGDDGEHSRTTIPWGEAEQTTSAIDEYAELIRLRRDNVALNAGGLRWVHVDDDALAYVREHQDQCVLVVAARSATTVHLPVGTIPGGAPILYGSATCDGDAVSAAGMSLTVWELPGVVAPAPSSGSAVPK